MVSCTEFIPFYSEAFKYLEKKDGHDGVVRFWEFLAKEYVAPGLGVLVKEKGIAGCWEYFSKSLNEEAADFTMTFDEEAQECSIVMHHCPSKGFFKKFTHLEPYYDYCGHCAVLYAPILAEYGIESESDYYSQIDEARCWEKYFIKK
jgi:hypothetical protein